MTSSKQTSFILHDNVNSKIFHIDANKSKKYIDIHSTLPIFFNTPKIIFKSNNVQIDDVVETLKKHEKEFLNISTNIHTNIETLLVPKIAKLETDIQINIETNIETKILNIEKLLEKLFTLETKIFTLETKISTLETNILKADKRTAEHHDSLKSIIGFGNYSDDTLNT